MRCAIVCLAAWSAWGVLAAPASAQQDWSASVFPERSFDLGTVARGSKVRHAFRVVNTTSKDIHILDSRTKCGCTEVRIGARDIPPGTQTVVEAVIDTTKFVGFKPSGLTLIIDRPFYAEVDLNLSCFIRGDVTLNPGAVDFGVAARSSQPAVTLLLTYAGGQPTWGITKLETISDHIKAEIREVSRSGGTVQYQLITTLKPSAPSGYFKDEVTLKTNDPNGPSIPVSVVGNVQAGVTVSPSILNFGHVKAGEPIKRTILVRSAQPFRVTDVKTKKDGLTVTKPTDASAPFHSLTLILKAPANAGPYNASVEISTDVKDEPPAKVTAFANVVP